MTKDELVKLVDLPDLERILDDQDHYLAAAAAGSLRKITYWDDVGCMTKSYLCASVDEIQQEHRVFIALLDALPMVAPSHPQAPTARIMDKTGKIVIAHKNVWAGVGNYWITAPELYGEDE